MSQNVQGILNIYEVLVRVSFTTLSKGGGIFLISLDNSHPPPGFKICMVYIHICTAAAHIHATNIRSTAINERYTLVLIHSQLVAVLLSLIPTLPTMVNAHRNSESGCGNRTGMRRCGLSYFSRTFLY